MSDRVWPSACRGLESRCQIRCGRVLVEDWSPDVRQGVAVCLSRTGVQMSDRVLPSACRGLESWCQTWCCRVLVEDCSEGASWPGNIGYVQTALFAEFE